jgi:hypothetical protein
VDGLRLEPPTYLGEEETHDWLQLVGAFDPDRFGLDHAPVLEALVSHRAVFRRIARELRALGARSLAHPKTRAVYLDLARCSREHGKQIALLSRVLRLTPDTTSTQREADVARIAAPVKPRPWEVLPPPPWQHEEADA